MTTPDPERARPEDLDRLCELLFQAVEWLAAKGVDQWHDMVTSAGVTDRARRRYAQAIAAGTCYVIRSNDQIVGTFILDTYADPEFWTDPTSPFDALYVHRMIVARDAAGSNLGAHMLEWASQEARRQGRDYLRLDAWSTNERLHRYYRELGLEQVRTLRLSHRGSGALFEKRIRPTASASSRTRSGPAPPK